MKNMTVKLGFSAIICLTMLACKSTAPVSSGIGAESITNEEPPATYLKVDNPDLAEKLTISYVQHRMNNELLEVNVELSSQFEKSMKLQYHFNWFDEQGFAVESRKSPWKPIELHGHQSTTLRGLAPASNVTSFNVYVRNASSNAYKY